MTLEGSGWNIASHQNQVVMALTIMTSACNIDPSTTLECLSSFNVTNKTVPLLLWSRPLLIKIPHALIDNCLLHLVLIVFVCSTYLTDFNRCLFGSCLYFTQWLQSIPWFIHGSSITMLIHSWCRRWFGPYATHWLFSTMGCSQWTSIFFRWGAPPRSSITPITHSVRWFSHLSM